MASSVSTAQAVQAGVDSVQGQAGVLQVVAADVWKVIASLQALNVSADDVAKKKAVLIDLMKIPARIDESCGAISGALRGIQQANADIYEWDARRDAFTTGQSGLDARKEAIDAERKILDAKSADWYTDFKKKADAAFPH